MSTFASYDQISPHYDSTRRPIGSEIILGCLAALGQPLGELGLLDAGCGTGAYSAAVIDRLRHIAAIDLNTGMLAAAKAKLTAQAAAGRIAFHQGSITDLPFESESFDAVMTNQVLHHLDDGTDQTFPVLRRAIAEFARVLRPGGALIVNTSTRDQLRSAYWYWHLAPGATERYCRRFAPLATLREAMAGAELAYQDRFVPLDSLCQGEAYFNGLGPLDPVWRNGDSYWTELADEELDQALARVRALDAACRLDAFVAEHDGGRPERGQITFLFARRPALP